MVGVVENLNVRMTLKQKPRICRWKRNDFPLRYGNFIQTATMGGGGGGGEISMNTGT